MPPHRVEFTTAAARDLRVLEKGNRQVAARIVEAIARLGSDPRPANHATELRGTTSAYRIRVGDYRVVYDVDDSQQLVTVGRIAHRRDAY